MHTKTILLVEDDFLIRRSSRKTLLENGYHVLEAKNASEAIDILKCEKVNLAILDIHLGENERDGISLGLELQRRYTIPFVYLTAYDIPEIASRALATTPSAYITKPFKNIDLLSAASIALSQMESRRQDKPTIIVKDEEYNVELQIDEIDYIESEGNYLLFYAGDRIYKSRSTIKQILEMLPKNTFIQTHRAFVVNKTKIEKFNIKKLMIKNEFIPVSRNFIDNIQGIYN